MRVDVSVIVPTFQRAALLDRCLTALSVAGANCAYEVVVVDDGSTDSTGDVLDRHLGRLPLTALRQPKNAGPAAARNRGLSESRGALVLFVDDDVVAAPDLLSRHLALHQATDDEQLAVLGRVDWHPDLRVTPFMRWLDRSGLQFAYDTWLQEGPIVPPYAAFYTANLSLHRRLLEAVGGFDERFPFPAYEDMELAHRLTARGLRMVYRPEALAWHARPIDLPTFRRRMAMVSASAALLREAAPDFPLEDDHLLHHDRRRRERWRLAVRAFVSRSDTHRAERYWAEVGHAYAAARATASAGTA